MNFSEDLGVGKLTFYLPTTFQLHRLTDNGDLIADRNRWKHTYRQTHTRTESDTLPTWDIGSSKNESNSFSETVTLMPLRHGFDCYVSFYFKKGKGR